MPELFLHIEVAGATQLDSMLPRIALELTDFSEPLRETGQAIYDDIAKEFADEGQTKQPEWPEYGEFYGPWKAKHHPGKPMLEITGALRRSLTGSSAPGSIHDVSSHTLTIGTSLTTPGGKWNLGLIHQLGAPDAPHPIPARPMIRLSEATNLRIRMIFQAWLQRKAAEADVEMSK